MTPSPIIDAHVHLGSWRHPGFRGLETGIEEVVQELSAAGVRGVALTTSDEADNRALLAAARSCPLSLWLFPWARPADPTLAALIAEHPEVRGLKIHASLERINLDDPRWDPIFDLAREHELRLMIHTGRWQEAAGFPLALERARRWPSVQMILSHAGGDTPDLCIGAAQETHRRGLDNVAFDTAGVREHWALERAMKIAGHHRYMMGSDFPLAHPAMYVAQFRALRLPDAWKPDLLGGNAARLLGDPSPAGDPIEPAPGTDLTWTHDVTAERAVLITGAGGPLGVNVTRSLRMNSVPLRLVGTDVNPYHRPLALTDRCLEVPRAGADGYLDRINQLIDEHRIDLVLPTHPVEVRALSAARSEVRAKMFLPPHEVILAGQDKLRSWELFRDAGVPVPATINISRPGDVGRAFDELGPPPIWFRGSGVPGAGIGVASLPCNDPEHARAWVDHHGGWGHFMASEYLPGDNLTHLSVWCDGVLWASQTRQRLEYVIPHVSPSGITGAPAVCRTVSRPEVHEIGEAAVRAICGAAGQDDGRSPLPHGIFFVDLKSDAAGHPRVTEINSGRFGTTIHFYTAAGFNFPELAVNLGMGTLPAAPVRDPIAPHTYWLRTLDCGPVLLPGAALEPDLAGGIP